MFPGARWKAVVATAMGCGMLVGCANPGPPKPPSLQVPAVVTDLSATRRGDVVELQFTLPQRTSDGVSLKPGGVQAKLCRAVDVGGCLPVGSSVSLPSTPAAGKTLGKLRDTLPANLSSGAAQLLTYRVELSNQQGRVAGYSDAAYAAAGAAPARVTDLEAKGSRLGVVLTWHAEGTEDARVLLRREDLNAQAHAPAKQRNATNHANGAEKMLGAGKNKPQSAVVLLDAAGEQESQTGSTRPAATLDTTAEPDEPYRYMAERRRTVNVSGHKLEVWSESSTPILFTLRDVFPPPAPRDLSVVGFSDSAGQPATAFAVDLIWEPVQDDRLAGYNVYRQEMASGGVDQKVLLTKLPVKTPALHDTTASGSKRYRYSVTSIDLKGNESDAATAVLEPQAP